MPDYTAKMVRYLLTHYFDETDSIESEVHNPNPGNPNETSWIGRADIDRAINALSKRNDNLWYKLCQFPPEIIQKHIKKLSPAQQHIIRNCLFGECISFNGYSTPCQCSESEPYSKQRFYCKESNIINRMAGYLNGNYEYKSKQHELAIMRGIDIILQAMSRATRKANLNLTNLK